MRDEKLLYRLKTWRAQQAMREGVEPFRVLTNATLEAMATERPLSREAFFALKGFKDAKWKRYGAMLLVMIADSVGEGVPPSDPAPREESFQLVENTPEAEDDVFTVSRFLDFLNDSFRGVRVRVRGEISSVDERERVVYFTLKDSQDDGMIACLMFRSQYILSGLTLEKGQEVIVEGSPEIWKPNGRLNLKVSMIELVGEGALKKAYDDLKIKLEQEGVFALEHKRPMPEFPERIALITSRDGAALGDFMMNVGAHGYRIHLHSTSVEGARAVPEIVTALRYFEAHASEYDVLVIIRGGGSLESLQAFNNETLVRMIASSTLPVLAGIGHERDVSLVALAADAMVSTPTATARALRESWDQATKYLGDSEYTLLTIFEKHLLETRRRIEGPRQVLEQWIQSYRLRTLQAEQALLRALDQVQSRLTNMRRTCGQWEAFFRGHDPLRLLALGYSLVSREGRLIRSVGELSPGDRVDIRLADGSHGAEIISE
jgi:exodeoxyribonuclease VII large subunit